MTERTDTFYHRVKTGLKETEGVQLVGEAFRYPQDRSHLCLNEDITFFVAPDPEIPFDPAVLNNFRKRIQLREEHWMSMESVWREFSLEGGGTTTSLIFPVISYCEHLKRLEDIVDLAACLRYLTMEQRVPDFSESYSRRLVNIHIYPNWSYAMQVHSYQEGLLRGKDPDETMDFLAHDISREQLDVLSNQLSVQLRYLPSAPLLARRRSN